MSAAPVTGNAPSAAAPAADGAAGVGGAWATTTVALGTPAGPFGIVTTAEATVAGTDGVGAGVGGAVVAGAVTVGAMVAGGMVVGAAVVGVAHTGMLLVPVSKLQPIVPVGSSNAETLTRHVCVTVGSPNANVARVAAANAVLARSAPSIHTRKVLTPSPL